MKSRFIILVLLLFPLVKYEAQVNLMQHKKVLNYFLANGLLGGEWFLKSEYLFNAQNDSLKIESNESLPEFNYWRFDKKTLYPLEMERFYKRFVFPYSIDLENEKITINQRNSYQILNLEYIDFNSFFLRVDVDQNANLFSKLTSFRKIHLSRKESWNMTNELIGQWKLVASKSLDCEMYFEKIDSVNVNNDQAIWEFDASGTLKTIKVGVNSGFETGFDFYQDFKNHRIYVVEQADLKCYRYEMTPFNMILTELFTIVLN